MATSLKEFEFFKLLEKYKSGNLSSMEIVRYANKYNLNCVLVLNDLRESNRD